MRNPLFEVGDKCLDNAADEIRQILQEWDDRFEFGTSDLREHYLRNRIDLHLHIRCGWLDGADYCAIFRYDAVATGDLGESNTPRDSGAERSEPRRGQYDRQEPMLVGVVEGLKQPEPMCVVRGTPIERLQSLDACFRNLGDTLYHSLKVGPVIGRREQDGELVLPEMGFAVFLNKGIDEVVEGRTELVYDFSRNDAEALRRLSAFPQRDDCLCRIGVVIGTNLIGLFSQKQSDLVIQASDVLVCPANLLSTAV